MAIATRDWCSSHPDGIRLALQVAPNAKKTEVIGIADDVLKIRLQAQPIDGKANEALIRFIAAELAVPRSAVSVTHGLSSKRKLLVVRDQGLSVETVRQRLLSGAG